MELKLKRNGVLYCSTIEVQSNLPYTKVRALCKHLAQKTNSQWYKMGIRDCWSIWLPAYGEH